MIDRETIYWGVCDICEAQTSAESDEESLRDGLKDMNWKWVIANDSGSHRLLCDECAT